MGKQMINIIGNHETMLTDNTEPDSNSGYKFSSGLVKNIIQRGINEGYFNTCVVVDTGIVSENGKHIFESYAHTMICKAHLKQMFMFLGAFLGKTESFVEAKFENNFSQMKSVFNVQFQNLPQDLRNKLEKFDFDGCLESNDIYQYLSQQGFNDEDFFRIKNVIGNSIFWFHNGGHCNGFINQKFLLPYDDGSNRGGMDWIFGERYLPEKDNSELFNVNQFVGHDYGDFVINVANNIIRLDTYRSVGYRNKESRCTVYISQLNSDKIILHEELLMRNNKVIDDSSKLKEENFKYGIANEVVGPKKEYDKISGDSNLICKKNDGNIKKYQSKGNRLAAFLPKRTQEQTQELQRENEELKSAKENANRQLAEKESQIQILQQENAELKTALSKVQNEKSGQKAQVAEQKLQVAKQRLQIAKQKKQISQTSQENRSSFLKSRIASAIEKSKQSLPNQTHNQATEIPLIPE